MRWRTDERVLAINPGSTSTKVAVFDGDTLFREGLLPAPETQGGGIWDEFPARLQSIRGWLEQEEIALDTLSCVVGRGGLLRPLRGGTYAVNEAMLSDARGNLQGTHASNLGCALAQALADAATRMGGPASNRHQEEGEAKEGVESGGLEPPGVRDGSIPAFVVDPVSTDEFQPLARFSGLREIPRKSLSHALSIHALVREVCAREGRAVEGSSFVVAHLGGGISVCPVRDGLILDANNANSGGPFSPSRAGGLPTQELLQLAFSGEYSLKELQTMTLKAGGMVSYVGTDDIREVETRIEIGDQEAELALDAMAYQIAKEIGAMATVLNGHLDAILLTGGLAGSALLMDKVKTRVEFLAPVEVLPAVEEMRALVLGGLRVLRGEEAAELY